MKKYISYITVGLVIGAILVLYMVTFTVRWKEKALVLSFGKISRHVTEPGLHGKWPWQTAVKFDGRIRTLQRQDTQTATRDKQNIIVTVYVNWRIDDAEVFYKRFRPSGSPQSADIVAAAEKTMRDSWIADALNVFTEYNFSELITLDPARFQLKALERGTPPNEGGMLKRLRTEAQAGDGYGVEVVDVGIRRLGVPDSVTAKVFERMREDRNKEVNALVADGNRLAETIKGAAQSEATMILARAQATAKSIKGQGDAEAAEHYSDFLAHPELANFLRRLDTLRKTLSERTTIVIDADSPPYNLLNQGPQIGSSSSPQDK